MRRSLLIGLFLVVCAAAWAVPARPGRLRYIQPDGSTVLLQFHGDEYAHWVTDAEGRTVEKGEDGFYRMVPFSHRPRVTRSRTVPRAASTNFGDRKVLCVLANFTDSTFVVENPHEAFYNLLNQPGYSANDGTGSVRDYYIDNSLGQYRPEFDVKAGSIPKR